MPIDNIKPVSPFSTKVHHSIDSNCIFIENGYYRATIDMRTGQLVELRRSRRNSMLPPARSQNDAFDILSSLIVEDRFDLTLIESGSEIQVSTSNRPATSVSVDVSFDFYHTVTTVSNINGYLYVRRTYEFTESPHVYEQAEFYLDGYPTGPGGLSPSQKIKHLNWVLQMSDSGVAVYASANPLIVDRPTSTFGEGGPSLSGSLGHIDFVESSPSGSSTQREAFARLAYRERFAGTQRISEIHKGEVLLASAVISVDTDNESSSLAVLFKERLMQFYPGYGLRSENGNLHSFSVWNDYQCQDWYIPLASNTMATTQVRKDCLIRITMHLVVRMLQHGWWPKHHAWSSGGVDYLEGDIFTANARSFPQLAYTWALLSVSWKDGPSGPHWVHQDCDADIIYRTLEELYNHYVSGCGVAHFEDSLNGRFPYIAYCGSLKQHNILNTHADGLQLAWTMIAASELRGDTAAMTKWRQLVESYHTGSRELFARCYPAMHEGIPYWGLLQYGIGSGKMEPWYTEISYNGLAAGYYLTGQYELEFVDAVETASYGNFDPLSEIKDEQGRPCYAIGDEGQASWVTRICRVFPPAIVFAGDTLTISESPRSADLRESLRYGLLIKNIEPPVPVQPSKHQSHMAIIEGGGRHIIFTNREFTTTWVPDFWEEKDPQEIPFYRRFGVWIQPQFVGQYWAASGTSQYVHLMTNFTPQQAVISFPLRHLKWTIYYYYYQNHRWLYPPQMVASGEKRVQAGQEAGIDVLLPFGLSTKVLAVILIESHDVQGGVRVEVTGKRLVDARLNPHPNMHGTRFFQPEQFIKENESTKY
jgi:hypothetical protein